MRTLSIFALFCLLVTAASANIRTSAGADTTQVLLNEQGRPLRFHHYFKLLYSGEYYLDLRGGKRIIRRQPDSIIRAAQPYRGKQDSADRVKSVLYRLSRAEKVVVLKSARKLMIERNGKAIFTFPINLGKNPLGHKQKDGDGRTPEGSYQLDLKMWTSQYYRNFRISYPDSTDVRAAKRIGFKPGGDVMIHGTSAQRSKLKDWTNGCIAISNAHMDTLFNYVAVGTQIEIRK